VKGSWTFQIASGRKDDVAIGPGFAQNPRVLARVLPAAVNGVEAFRVEAKVNSGWRDAAVETTGLK
jgi:hypothetical protein